MVMKSSLLAFTLFLALSACGGDDVEEEDVDLEACTLIKEAATTMTASATRNTAPKITPGATPYQLTLSSTTATYVRFDTTAAAGFVFFLRQDNVASGKFFAGETER